MFPYELVNEFVNGVRPFMVNRAFIFGHMSSFDLKEYQICNIRRTFVPKMRQRRIKNIDHSSSYHSLFLRAIDQNSTEVKRENRSHPAR
jgi:hypothetical protein